MSLASGHKCFFTRHEINPLIARGCCFGFDKLLKIHNWQWAAVHLLSALIEQLPTSDQTDN
jgi:hypothetical protein